MNRNEGCVSRLQVLSLSQEHLIYPVFLPVALSVFSLTHPGTVPAFLCLFEAFCL